MHIDLYFVLVVFELPQHRENRANTHILLGEPFPKVALPPLLTPGSAHALRVVEPEDACHDTRQSSTPKKKRSSFLI